MTGKQIDERYVYRTIERTIQEPFHVVAGCDGTTITTTANGQAFAPWTLPTF